MLFLRQVLAIDETIIRASTATRFGVLAEILVLEEVCGVLLGLGVVVAGVKVVIDL